MRAQNKWQDYKLLDATDGYRLESWGGVILVRPDPQIVWKFEKKSPMWEKPTLFTTAHQKAAVNGNTVKNSLLNGISAMTI